MGKINKHYFIILVILFLVTRLLMALFLAPHNDEVIYTQYAQLINHDWQNNKYLSVDGRFLGDYKEPFQYWLTSMSVNWWTNPLWGVRLWSIIFSLGGFVAWFYLAKKLLGTRIAKIFALLYIFSGYYLYFDAIGLAEVYVYSLGAIFLWFSYLWLMKARWYYLIMAGAIFSLALLAKNSAWLILVLGLAIPYLLVVKQPDIFTKQKKSLVLYYIFLLANVVVAKVIYWLLVPMKFESIRLLSPASEAIRLWPELIAFPVFSWLNNLSFYFIQVLSRDRLFILWLGCLFFGLYLGWREQLVISSPTRKLFFGLGIWWLISLAPIILLAKTIYFRHYGMWLTIFYLWLAWVINMGIKFFETNTKTKLFAKVVVVLGSVLILNQAYSSFYPALKFHQTDAGEQETTDLWASPLGITELIDYLKTLPPATVLYDAQWGHFSTDLFVFNRYYPQLKFVSLESEVGKKFIMSSNNFKEQKMFIIFDTYWLNQGSSGAPLRQIIQDPRFCGQKKEIVKNYRQLVLPSKIVVCEIN